MDLPTASTDAPCSAPISKPVNIFAKSSADRGNELRTEVRETARSKRQITNWLRRCIDTCPRLPHLILFYAAYVVGGGFGQGLAIIPGVEVTFWPPAGILIATLLSNSVMSRSWWLLFGGLAELTCNALWFHNPLPFALIYYGANVLEAVIATSLIRRFVSGNLELATLQEVGALVFLGAGLAPLAGASVIAVTDYLRGKHSFLTAWAFVWLGDGTGLLVSTPLTLFVVNAWRKRQRISLAQLLEAVFLAVILLAVIALTWWGHFPTLYLALPALLWAAVRFQVRGTAVALGLVTLLTAYFAASGKGDFVGRPELLREKMVMLQTFLGISAISSLIVAALSLQRQQAVLNLKTLNAELEARVAERTATLGASEEFARRISDVAPSILYIFDLLENRNIWGNREMFSGLGYSLAEIEAMSGKLIETLMHPDDLVQYPAHVARIKTLEDGETAMFDYRFRRADGSWRWIHSRDMVFRRNASGTPIQIIGAALDVTERKLSDAKLQEAHIQLSDRALHLEALVQQRTSRLNEMVRDLEAFSYSLIHDMRAPLRAMQSFAALLSAECGTSEAAELYSKRIRIAAERMDALIRDGLHYSRLMQAELRLVPVDLAALIRGMIETYPTFEPPHAVIELVGRFPRILGNEAVLTQCVSNLLGNAVKFVRPGVKPLVKIWAEKREGRVRVWFEDNGIGIPKEQYNKIFEIFQRLNPNYEGTGIGLAIVKKAAERMGGSVGLDSTVGLGSRFWLEFSSAPELAGT